VEINKIKSLSKRRSKSNKFINVITSDNDYVGASESFDTTLIPTISNNDNEYKHYSSSGRKNINYSVISDNEGGSIDTSSIDKLFPSPRVIIKDIYEIYKTNKSTRERDSAVLNYINLFFRNNN